MTGPGPHITLTIHPEPTDNEAEALAAALAILLTRPASETAEPPRPRISRWAMAGRTAAHTTRSTWNRHRPRNVPDPGTP